MNDATHRMLGRFVWFVSGLGSMSIGLQALGLDVYAAVPVESMTVLIQYGFGLCGLASILMFFMKCCKGCNIR